MAARRRAWGDKKPWWVWIDAGNVGLYGVHPEFTGTGFLWVSQDEIQTLYDNMMEIVENEEFGTIDQAISRFSIIPDTYEPFDILATFYAEGKEFKVYVTEKRKVVGVTEARRLR